MKTLILVRHGKAEDQSFNKKDYDRNLVEKGILDIEKLAIKLEQLDLKVEHIISSAANRAYQTAQIISPRLGIAINYIETQVELYECSLQQLLRSINLINDGYKTVLLTGHNPTFEYMIEYLTNERIAGGLGTSGAAVIEFDLNSWALLSEGMGRMKILYN
jgi:phosphohistidine phosphatase